MWILRSNPVKLVSGFIFFIKVLSCFLTSISYSTVVPLMSPLSFISCILGNPIVTLTPSVVVSVMVTVCDWDCVTVTPTVLSLSVSTSPWIFVWFEVPSLVKKDGAFASLVPKLKSFMAGSVLLAPSL